MKKKHRVLLIQPPFAPYFQPSFALGRLKSVLCAEGFHCESRDLSVELLDCVGQETLDTISDFGPIMPELLFGAELYPSYLTEDILKRRTRLFRNRFGLMLQSPGRLLRSIRSFNGKLLKNWGKQFPYDVVGISAQYHLMPALFYAHALKKLNSRIQIVLGGVQCIGDVGRAIAEKFTFLDWVVDGEGESAILDIMEALARASDETPPQTSRRLAGKITHNTSTRAFVDLNTLPYPNFDEYYEYNTVQKLSFNDWLPIEASRGCWWGKCVFCGLDDRGIQCYRRMSDQRVTNTMEYLAGRYKQLHFRFVDSVQPTKLMGLTQKLISSPFDYTFHMSLRADIPSNHLEQLALAGLRECQIGIESFSQKALDRMNKHIDVLNNIRILRESHRLGIKANFNIISPFPLETRRDINVNRKTFETISHLCNPSIINQLTFGLEYGSEAYKYPKQHGITKLWPHKSYGLFLPPQYRFKPTFHWDFLPNAVSKKSVPEFILDGSISDDRLELEVGGPNFCSVRDSRTCYNKQSGGSSEYTLESSHKETLLACNEPRKRNELNCSKEVISDLLKLGFICENNGRYISVAVRLRSTAPASHLQDADFSTSK